jgi:hypothetical protein
MPTLRRLASAAHAPTPLVEPKMSKDEFTAFFSQDNSKVKNTKIVNMLGKMPPPSPDEIDAIGHFLGASNLAALQNEAAMLKSCGNDFKKITGRIHCILSEWCESDSVFRGAMAEVRDWQKQAAEHDAFTLFTWHHDRLAVGVYPTYFG